jgi:hypothetical protein
VVLVAGAELAQAVVDIALAEVDNSETFGAVALGFVIAGAIAMLAALVVVAIAYAARHGLLIARQRQGGGRAASLETGGAGLAHPGPFGQLALRRASSSRRSRTASASSQRSRVGL